MKKKRIKLAPIKGRLYFAFFAFVIFLTILGGRVYYWKTVKGAEFENRAKEQQVNRYDVMVQANRGSIVDRNNQPFAVSTIVYDVILDSRVLALPNSDEKTRTEQQEKTFAALQEVFPDLNYTELRHGVQIDPATNKPYTDNSWKVLAKSVDKEIKESLEAQKLKGIYFEQTTKRTYPLKSLACHVIGFMRGDAKWGIESYYDKYMTGTPGRSFIAYDGNSTAVRQEYDAEDGNTVVTTIDYTIQQYAENIVMKTAEQWPSEAVAIMVMNPNTGEIYAMADSSSFDLNEPDEIPAMEDEEFREQWEAMTTDEQIGYKNTMWRNFNVTSSFEPGSIFKPITVAAALEEGIIRPEDTFNCTGAVEMYEETMRCHLRSGHNILDVQGALAQSCNPSMIYISQRMGKEIMYKYFKDFGFGSRTNIDLPAEESAAGAVYTEDAIGPVELATMSFGQGFNATAIQAITAFSAVINGGNLMKPYVVSQVIDKNGNIVYENEPQVQNRVISRETSDTMRIMMKATIEEGTGKKAKIEGYSIGGKTGTAQNGSRKQNNKWALSCLTYFPVENPQYVVLTLIYMPENYQDGVQTPVPMTKEMMESIIKYKNIQPSYAEDGTTITKKQGTVTVDDYTGSDIFSTLLSLDSKNLNYQTVGTGNVVVNQFPHGGTQLEEGSQITLYVEKGEDDEGTMPVPDVRGKTYTEAVTLLNDSGFEAEAENEKTKGVVLSQKPKYGVSVELGTKITLTMGEKEDEEDNTTNE
ncbi:MAG: PASTA domain-containing protein [Firmicutes bacterium]|nr:PASTA domain-containing protein [Bacillota bacterium]